MEKAEQDRGGGLAPSAAATAAAMVVIESALKEVSAQGGFILTGMTLQAIVDRLTKVTGMDCTVFTAQIKLLAARRATPLPSILIVLTTRISAPRP